MNEEIKDDQLACPGCLHINDPTVHFCAKCGAPVSALANIGPWERTLSEGFAYRQAVSGPAKRIVVVGMWMVCAPAVWLSCDLAIGAARSLSAKYDAGTAGTLAVSSLSIIVFAILLYRTTRNYRIKKILSNKPPDAACQ